MTVNRKPSKTQQLRRAAVKAALPEVKSLVAKHGRPVVNSCLIKLNELNRKQKRADELRAQLDRLLEELR